VAFEKHASDARYYVQLASVRNLGFWTELVEAQPDLSKLHRLSSEMNNSCTAAEAAFVAALELVAQSVFILRLYGAFNQHVLVNTDKADVLLAEAERIEEASSKEHRSEGTSLMMIGEESTAEIWTEATSYLTVSASARDVGTILSVNSAACKLFGLSRLQLERRSVFTLLPAPLDEFYEANLRSHAVSGEGSIVNFTRLSFVLTRSGTITPVVASFKDAPADDGPPAFFFIARELQSTHNCILMNGSDVIFGATPGSLALLSTTSASLRSRELRMGNYCEEWGLKGVREELLSPAGRLLRIDVEPISAGAAAGDDDSEDGFYSEDEQQMMESRVSSRRTLALRAEQQALAPAVLSTWVRAHLQEVKLLGPGKAYVLHWTRIPTADATLIQKPTLKRNAQLSEGAPNATTTSAPHPRVSSTTSGSATASSLYVQVSEGAPDAATASAPHPRVSSNTSSSTASSLSVAGAAPLHTAAGMALALAPLGGGATFPASDSDAAKAVAAGMDAERAEEEQQHPTPPPPISPPPPAVFNTSYSATLKRVLVAEEPESSSRPMLADALSSQPLPPRSQRASLSVRSPPSQRSLSRSQASSKGRFMASRVTQSSAREQLPSQTPSRTPKSGNDEGSGIGVRGALGGEDRRSKDDRSSSTSETTRVGRTMARLRRVLGTEAAALMPGLWWLQLAGRALVLLAIILTVTLVLVTRASFLGAYNNILYVHTASDALYYKGAAIIAAQNLVLHGRGWVPLSDAAIARYRAQILLQVNNFLTAEATLFSLAQSAGNAEAFTKRYITITHFELPSTSLAGNLLVMNAREVAADFAVTMQAIASMSVADFSAFSDGSARGNPHLASLNTNYMRGGNGHDGLLYTGNLGYLSTLKTQVAIITTQRVVFGSMTGALALLGVFIFLPILVHVDRTGDEIMSQFVRLPLAVRRGLFAQAQRRMLMLRRFTREDDDADDRDDEFEAGAGEDAVAVDFDERAALAAALAPRSGHHHQQAAPAQSSNGGGGGGAAAPTQEQGEGGSGSTAERASATATGSAEAATKGQLLPQVEEDGSLNWNAVLEGGALEKEEAKRRRKGAPAAVFRKSAASFLMLVLRFLAPLIVLEVLFAAVYATFDSTAEKTLALTSVSAAANVRASCGRQALADLIKLMYVETPDKYTQYAYLSTFQSVACVLDHTALLAFGTVPRTLNEPYTPYTPVVEAGSGGGVLSSSSSEAVYSAMFSNACPFVAARSPASFNTTACERFSNGVVQLGLAAVAQMWASKFKLLGDAKLRTTYTAAGLGNGTGYIVPSALFNYSSVSCSTVEGAGAPECVPQEVHSGPPANGKPLSAAPQADVAYGGATGAWPTGATPHSIAAAFSSAEYQWLVDDLAYLTVGLRGVASLYDDEAQSIVLGYVTFLLNFSACWLTFFTLVIFFYFIPSVVRKNNDIHTTRSMLLYLPVPVVSRVKSILALVEDILARNSDDALSKGAGSSTSGRQVAPLG
jgi:PAS domain S-box-containing protein